MFSLVATQLFIEELATKVFPNPGPVLAYLDFSDQCI